MACGDDDGKFAQPAKTLNYSTKDAEVGIILTSKLRVLRGE
jgi:hypothetical protein